MKKEQCLKLIEKQKETIEKLENEIDKLNIKLQDYDEIQHLNIELQSRVLEAERRNRENNYAVSHLQHELEIYETTFKALSGGE